MFFSKIKISFFWCGPFLKSLLNLLQYCLCFMVWFFRLCGRWDLSSLTRDQTCTPWRQNLNTCITWGVPLTVFSSLSLHCLLPSLLPFVHLVRWPFTSNPESLQPCFSSSLVPDTDTQPSSSGLATGGPGHICFYGKSYLDWPSSYTDTRNTKSAYFYHLPRATL